VTRLALILVVVFAGACEEEKDAPEALQRKAECRQLEKHIFRITPGPGGELPASDPASIATLMAKVPIEDIEQCVAAKPAVLTCMLAAPDVAALRACIPAKTE
jgi:hypothetical protein